MIWWVLKRFHLHIDVPLTFQRIALPRHKKTRAAVALSQLHTATVSSLPLSVPNSLFQNFRSAQQCKSLYDLVSFARVARAPGAHSSVPLTTSAFRVVVVAH